ncbi:hypothetical protein [Lachnospira pectinoschiza]|uniref:DUF5610 domain-containing protein n=1 Tax=Lachnospira pectinoschiza TaxID=28052 RepID=A0A1G9XQ20_9FIRM|nr:hypothetical protein [Lachnospira pectinoschiza]SDM98363.1 hypothetical protein SAMN05216544_1577 [Lachnospira pectinoschiza]
MELNGVNSAISVAATETVASKYSSKASKSNSSSTSEKAIYSDVAATYESSSNSSQTASTTRQIANPELVEQLKADLEARTSQMQSLVTQMFQKQGIAIGSADDMWKQLASGNFTVDEATRKQAEEDISEDGYWGVKQTSERIFSFAKALAGDDVETMKKMQAAVEKGFKAATKTWGKELPDISNQTLDAVNTMFEDYYNSKSESTNA